MTTEATDSGITIVDCDDAADFEANLEKALRTSLVNDLPQSNNRSMNIAAKSADGKIVGGLSAATSYDWLHIGLLWIDDDYRRRGLGAALLERAIARAAALGCSACWLETSNPAARDFYRAEGFTEFGKLSNENQRRPDSHRRWFLQRSF